MAKMPYENKEYANQWNLNRPFSIRGYDADIPMQTQQSVSLGTGTLRAIVVGIAIK